MVADNASNLYYLSDDQVFCMTTTPIHLGNKVVQHS